MATTESRSGFRLPWSADRAPSRDGSEEYPANEQRPGDPELTESELEAPEAVHPATGDEPGTPTGDKAASPDAAALAPDDHAEAPGAPVAFVAPPTVPVADPPFARRPSKFLADLTHAVQAAAQQARAATLEQFQVDGSSYVEQIHGRSVAAADALRRHADEDVASIKDWSKAEIARIREETENRIAGRRGQLDGQLARHATLVERDVARIEGQIASFETEMAAFFDELLSETDLTVLAARAQQMPEAPAFDELDDTAFTALMTEPAVGMPVAEPKPKPVAGLAPVREAESSAAIAEAVADADAALPSTQPSTGDLPFDRDAAMAAIQVAAEAAASLEAATAKAAEDEAPAVASAAELDAAPQLATDDAPPALDPRLRMLGLTPDFAAAEEAAAEAAAAEMQEIPEMDEENLTARLAGLVPSSASSATATDGPGAPAVSTQVVVTGLVSVASIASFKRHLGRAAGVRHVGVSSGPDGEFLFTVQHEAEISLRDLIPTLPGFQARVTGGGSGVVTASAHDPED